VAEKKDLLRNIPKVDDLLRSGALTKLSVPANYVKEAIQKELGDLRERVKAGELSELPAEEKICGAVRRRVLREALPSLCGVINGTGVVLCIPISAAPA